MTEAEIKQTLVSVFKKRFGAAGPEIFFAPGRINLIGEHIDYNGGHVLPCALSLGTYAAVKRRNDGALRLYSENLCEDGITETSLDELKSAGLPAAAEGSWAMYPLGVVLSLCERGFSPSSGFDMAVMGNLPAGAGLSSSASLEVLTAFALRSIFGFKIEDRDLALMCQRAERTWCGTNCGIMDQFASALAKEGSALCLNTKTLEYEYVPLKLPGAKLVISNTNKKHKLAGSAYNDRRSECALAMDILRYAEEAECTAKGKEMIRLREFLCDFTPREFEKYKYAITDPVLLGRARHAVYENARTLRAAEALRRGDMAQFGCLMCEAHVSISRDFEASCKELDILQEEALKIPGVYGSRMSGGGFGGCTVSIVKDEASAEFKDKVGAAYLARTGLAADFYIAEPSGGPKRL